MIRLTAQKTENQGNLDFWINGSMDQTPEAVAVLQSYFEATAISLEKGKGQTGQLHWQIWAFCGKSRKRRSAVRQFLEDHFEGLIWPSIDYCEPCCRIHAGKNYCVKQDTRVAGPWLHNVEPPINMTMTLADLPTIYPWQKEIIDRYKDQAPVLNPQIHWYVDPEGQQGKTTCGKFLHFHNKFQMLDGSAQKMKFIAAKYPAIGYYLNIPRSKEDHFSYEGLESVSDGNYVDTFGSDMQGMIMRKASWMVIFTNWLPDYHKMTLKRNVVRLWSDAMQRFVLLPNP